MLLDCTNVLLTPIQRNRLERTARERGVSVATLISAAIDAYIGTESRTRREAADRLLSMKAPVGDWSVMKSEIVGGAMG